MKTVIRLRIYGLCARINTANINKVEESVMSETTGNSKWIYVRWFVIRFILIVYDVLAVNAASYLALVTRFYVAKEFHSAAIPYIEAYTQYAPYYTVFCLVIFGCFKLYSGMWKYAGFNDLNRIIGASLVCFATHVVGTILFARRMPISFYCLGAVIQFCLIAASRFSYRLLLIEKEKVSSGGKDAAINAMVIGTGGTGKIVLQQLEREKSVRPVCALNYKESGFGYLMNGLPVVSGVENLKGAVQKYRVNFVIIASTVMPRQTRNRIKAICKEINVEVQDYSASFLGMGSRLTLRSLAECVEGPVELVIRGEHQKYGDCEQALTNVAEKYVVKSILAKDDTLVIELDDHSVVQNDLNAEWVKNQEKETGEAISFF